MSARFLLAPLCLAAGAALASQPVAGVRIGLEPDEGLPTTRLIVKYRSGDAPFPSARAEMAARVAANRQGVSLGHLRRLGNGAHLFTFDRGLSDRDARVLAADLAAGDPNVDYAEPDRLLQALAVPADPLFSQQWSLSDAAGGIRAAAAWGRSTGKGVTVAVIDSGVRPHADLVANLLPGYDFVSDLKMAGDGGSRDADAYDPGDAVSAGACGAGSGASTSSWHGTHVAGIVAAAAGNNAGVVGVAYGAKVLPLRALGRCGGWASDIADAITWAAGGAVAGVPANKTPARVINLSLGGIGACDRTTQAAIDSARAAGAVVVVAAGNETRDVSQVTPASCKGVVAVAATSQAGGRASYSNFGTGVTLAAPGGDKSAGILSTLNAGRTTPTTDNYVAYVGTSMAAPVVSGVVALMLATNDKLTPDQVAALLKSSARAFPAACSQCGAGLVDAGAAVAQAAGAPAATTTPPTTPTPPATTTATAPLALKDTEPNNTLATAQVVASLPATITGSLATTTDTDFFKVTVAAGKTLTVTLTAGAKSAFGLNAYGPTNALLMSASGSAGVVRQLKLNNVSAQALKVTVRVLRSSGTAGAYTLQLAQ